MTAIPINEHLYQPMADGVPAEVIKAISTTAIAYVVHRILLSVSFFLSLLSLILSFLSRFLFLD